MSKGKIATSLAIITALSVGGLEVEKGIQLSDIHAKTGINASMIMATAWISDSHRKNVGKALIEEFDKDGFVDYDNYALHMTLLNKHYEELSDSGELPDWLSNTSELTDDEIIKNIHNSIKNNNEPN